MAKGLDRLRGWARRVKRDVLAVWLAARDRRTPWSARLVGALTAAYALSPVDLIPDVIPVLGLLDDLLIVPLGLMLAVRLIPGPLMAEFRARAAEMEARPRSWMAAVVVVGVWVGVMIFAIPMHTEIAAWLKN